MTSNGTPRPRRASSIRTLFLRVFCIHLAHHARDRELRHLPKSIVTPRFGVVVAALGVPVLHLGSLPGGVVDDVQPRLAPHDVARKTGFEYAVTGFSGFHRTCHRIAIASRALPEPATRGTSPVAASQCSVFSVLLFGRRLLVFDERIVERIAGLKDEPCVISE
jgi:hypothetical protein